MGRVIGTVTRRVTGRGVAVANLCGNDILLYDKSSAMLITAVREPSLSLLLYNCGMCNTLPSATLIALNCVDVFCFCFPCSDTACRFHTAPPIFHDTRKGWGCCEKRVYDWDEFEQLVGEKIPFFLCHGKRGMDGDFWINFTIVCVRQVQVLLRI